jgi:nicotinamide mononucleotide transporter
MEQMFILKWLFEAQIHFGNKAIAIREIIGGGLGLASAVLGMRRKVSAWPIGILGDGLLFTVFCGALFSFSKKSDHPALYGQAGRNLLLIIVSFYGWVVWAKNRNSGQNKPPVTPRWTTTREKIVLIPLIVVMYFGFMQIFSALGEKYYGQWLYVDTWIFTGTALATYSMSRGFVEFWLVWIAVDIVGVPFAFAHGNYPTGILYGIYMPFVIWGFFSWIKIQKSESTVKVSPTYV